MTAVTQHIKPDVYPPVDDEATIIVTYPKAQVILQASWNWPYDRKDLEIYGQTGAIFTIGKNDLLLHRNGSIAEQIAAKPALAPYDNSVSYLKAVISGDIKPDGPSSLAVNVIVTRSSTPLADPRRLARRFRCQPSSDCGRIQVDECQTRKRCASQAQELGS